MFAGVGISAVTGDAERTKRCHCCSVLVDLNKHGASPFFVFVITPNFALQTVSATLTLKSRSSKLRRREFEYAIPTLDAEELISLRRSYVIEKVRHVVPCGNRNWEVDVFSGENQGLVVAEI